MSVPNNREHHYRNLRDRYTNCTYVDGNLELTWLQDENLDLSFLQHIREVTGYVLISHVDVTKIILPSLQIIRGRTLFKLNVQDDEFALIVTLSKMNNLEMPALRGRSNCKNWENIASILIMSHEIGQYFESFDHESLLIHPV
jgi:epidermal growth factor receptor